SIILDAPRRGRIMDTIVNPVIRATQFTGFLYAGLMLTPDGPRVLEFNVRLGDPETQAIVPRVDAPLAQLMLECAQGSLSVTGALPVVQEATVALFLAAHGYPETARRGDVISGIDAA